MNAPSRESAFWTRQTSLTVHWLVFIAIASFLFVQFARLIEAASQ